MCVGPYRVTTGRSNAAAKWRGPLSVVTSRSQRRTHALVRPSDSGGPSGRSGAACPATAWTAGWTARAANGRAAQHQHAGAALHGQVARQGRKVFGRPVLCGAEGAAGIQTNNLGVFFQT